MLSKTRYGNGIKLNLEWGLFSKQKVDSSYLKQYRKPRDNHPKAGDPLIHPTNIWKPEKLQSIPSDSLFSFNTTVQPQQKSITNTAFAQMAISIQNLKEFKADSTKPDPPKKVKYEKNAKIAGWLFFGGIVFLFFSPFLGFLAIVAGFVFTIIALKKIEKEKKKKEERQKEEKMKGKPAKGKRLALSIVVALAVVMIGLAILIALLILDIVTNGIF